MDQPSTTVKDPPPVNVEHLILNVNMSGLMKKEMSSSGALNTTVNRINAPAVATPTMKTENARPGKRKKRNGHGVGSKNASLLPPPCFDLQQTPKRLE